MTGVPPFFMEKEKRNQTVAVRRASTSDILGASFGGWKVDPRWEKHYQMLDDLRNSVVNRRKSLVKQAAEEMAMPQQNMEEAGTDHYDRDFALGMASSDQEVLYEIEHALSRIKNGGYGICELTGEPIEPDRLEAIPWARYSSEAEKELEAEGQRRRPRFGELELIPRETVMVEEEAGEAA
jgi:RNA polymerase-binding transcription factor DksA